MDKKLQETLRLRDIEIAKVIRDYALSFADMCEHSSSLEQLTPSGEELEENGYSEAFWAKEDEYDKSFASFKEAGEELRALGIPIYWDTNFGR